jgi:Do/DeqQ family serine protease
MRRLFALALGVLAVAALGPAPSAYSSIPVLALGDGKTLPSLAPVIRNVAAGVVSIAIRTQSGQAQNSLFDDPALRQLFGLPDMPPAKDGFAAGSGVVIDGGKGLIVTNYHVVQNADQITVTLLDGRQVAGVLQGSDPDTDIALIKVPLTNLTSIPFGDSERLEVGDFVLAMGNPFGIGQTVTSGIVSGLRRNGMGLESYEDFIQTDASINPGNSGGALVNLRGELIGINAAIVGPSGGNVGIGFAIPINMVRAISAQLVKYGTIDRGELGVSVSAPNPELARKFRLKGDQAGVVVTSVESNSAGEKAGVRLGDVVTAFGDAAIRDTADFRNRLGMLRVGDAAKISVIRDGKQRQLEAVLSEPTLKAIEGEALSPLLAGALFANSSKESGERGAQVATLRGGSEGWKAGLREGDIVLSVNRKRVIGVEEFAAEVGKSPNELVLNVIRGGERVLVSVRHAEPKTPSSKGPR